MNNDTPTVEGLMNLVDWYADLSCGRNQVEEYATRLAEGARASAGMDADRLTEMEARKDAAYLERNQVVAALAKCFPSGVARTAIEGWSEDWHGCVYIDLPTGQASWHFHDSQAHLFRDLPPYTGTWDGHDTPEKYRRLAALERASAGPDAEGVKRLVRAAINEGYSEFGTAALDRAMAAIDALTPREAPAADPHETGQCCDGGEARRSDCASCGKWMPFSAPAAAPAPDIEQLRIQVRQADERGDTAMRLYHSWMKVAVETGDWLPDEDCMPRKSASRTAAPAPTEPAKADFEARWRAAWDQYIAGYKPKYNTFNNQNFFLDGYKAGQAAAPAPAEPVPWRSIVAAIQAVDVEARRRGSMFPQTADEQDKDRAAVRRVAEMVEWYATKGGAVAEKLPGWPRASVIECIDGSEAKEK